MIYLKRANSQGNSVAQYNYGLLLTGGYEEYFKYYNSTEAIVWLKIAAHNGNERAKVELENLGKRRCKVAMSAYFDSIYNILQRIGPNRPS